MFEENRKIQLTREEIVQKKMRSLLAFGAVLTIVGIFLGAMVAALTFGVARELGEYRLIIQILMIAVFVMLWFTVAAILAIAAMNLYQALCLLQGKYAIETDKIALLELKTETEYRRNVLGKGYHKVRVTNQYVHFETYGKVQSDRHLSQGEECYLLVVQTKKPHVLEFWECNEYEIKGA